MTKGSLYQIHMQFEAWKNNGNVALLWCNKEKINEFYDQNKEHINSLVKQIDKLHEKYFVIKNDKIQSDPKGRPMYKHSMSPLDFEAEQDALFSSEVSSIVLVKT